MTYDENGDGKITANEFIHTLQKTSNLFNHTFTTSSRFWELFFNGSRDPQKVGSSLFLEHCQNSEINNYANNRKLVQKLKIIPEIKDYFAFTNSVGQHWRRYQKMEMGYQNDQHRISSQCPHPKKTFFCSELLGSQKFLPFFFEYQ